MFEPRFSESPEYRETIQRSSIGERKYIRFFAGQGHFAHLRLLLVPCPGRPCVVTSSERLGIPAPCSDAAEGSIRRKFEGGPIRCYPMLGVEVRILGGTFLAKYSHPEAFARVAEMAFDEAVFAASAVVVERCCGFTLKVDPEAIRETLETLTGFLGEVPATISFNALRQYFVIQAQAPVRLLARLRQLLGIRRLETHPLPVEQQYRVVTGLPQPPEKQDSPLDDWT